MTENPAVKRRRLAWERRYEKATPDERERMIEQYAKEQREALRKAREVER